MSAEYFIDSHLHFFRPQHLPISLIISYFAKKYRFLGLLPIPKVFDTMYLFDKNKAFIEHFDNSIDTVIVEIIGEIFNAISNTALFRDKKLILTPLVIDFGTDSIEKKYFEQIDYFNQIFDEISLPAKVNIIPFIGIDPRRPKHLIDQVLNTVASTNSSKLLKKGFGGVKLYPSLGFNPLDLIEIFKNVIDKDIAFTVHCQESSLVYKRGNEQFNDPKVWENILSIPAFNSLRINFAHYGGVNGILNAVHQPSDGHGHFSTKHEIGYGSWTVSIIKMLKKYPNTYADISALDFHYFGYWNNFKLLLLLDCIGFFDHFGKYCLTDKIIWGSDYPMYSRGSKNNYSNILNSFISGIHRKCSYEGSENVAYNKLYEAETNFDPNNFITKISSCNPMKFHFGTI